MAAMSNTIINAATTQLCKCGCGRPIKTKASNGKIILYKPGHHLVKGKLIGWHEIECAHCLAKVVKRNAGSRYCSRQCYWNARGMTGTAPAQNFWRTRECPDRNEFRVVRSKRIQRLYMMAIQPWCGHCGWKLYPDVLELHHKDHNQGNGERSNLELLCPTCHDVHHYLTKTGKYDNGRYERIRARREALGMPVLMCVSQPKLAASKSHAF
jgi:hypothetical protein